MIYNSILDLIGNTPLVPITALNPNPAVTIYAKLEGQNPGGSVKDRAALAMIVAAEKSGELTHEKTILEPTSGNTGIGLALVAAVKGYRVVVTMSAAMSDERKKTLRAYGADIIETDPLQGTDGAIRKAQELYAAHPEHYWMPYQFSNPNNPLAHYHGTAEEIIADVPHITHFVAGLGSSATLMGTGKRLKEHNPHITIVGVEPQERHTIAGLKNMREAIVPTIYDESALDQKVVVDNEAAYATARSLTRREGIFVGMSAGASMYATLQLATTLTEGTIVTLLPDRGDKYLSTSLFE